MDRNLHQISDADWHIVNRALDLKRSGHFYDSLRLYQQLIETYPAEFGLYYAFAKAAYLLGNAELAKWGYLVTAHGQCIIIRSFKDEEHRQLFSDLANATPEARRNALAKVHRVAIHMSADNNTPRHMGHVEHDLVALGHRDEHFRKHVEAYRRALQGHELRDRCTGQTELPEGLDEQLEDGFYTDLGLEVLLTGINWDQMGVNLVDVHLLYPQPMKLL